MGLGWSGPWDQGERDRCGEGAHRLITAAPPPEKGRHPYFLVMPSFDQTGHFSATATARQLELLATGRQTTNKQGRRGWSGLRCEIAFNVAPTFWAAT